MSITALPAVNSSVWQNSAENLSEQKTGIAKYKDLATKYAGIIDSRESLVRLALEFFGADLPITAASAFRNRNTFIEKLFENSISFLSFLVAPAVTEIFAKIGGKIFAPEKSSKEITELINLNRKDLRDENSFYQGVDRVLNEEVADRNRISQLYSAANKNKQAEKFSNQAHSLTNLFNSLNYDKKLASKIRNIKEFTIVGESLFEGTLWGGFGLALRWFRKNILGLEGFSGTGSYTNKEEAQKLGQQESLSIVQKIGGVAMIFFAPVTNFILMKLTENKGLLAKNKFLQMIDKNYEMTHGLYPKLGLMFSYTSLPKWIGTFITAQGHDELIERILTFATLITSWWQGQKLTNGLLARFYDKKLQNNFAASKGTLVDKEHHGHVFPEQARIHQVLEMTDHDPNLQEEAKKSHAKTLYAGIGLHSLGIFLLSLMINKITEWRVKSRKTKLNI